MHEKSCGLIVYYKKGDFVEYLLLHYPQGHWDLPKGHVEEGENEKQTALRELKEETGIDDAEVKESFREEIHYFFKRKEKLISKKVVFFLAETKSKKVKISDEHKNFIWLDFTQAHKKLTFENVRIVLKKAHSFFA